MKYVLDFGIDGNYAVSIAKSYYFHVKTHASLKFETK